MKKIISIFVVFAILGCSQQPKTIETFLVCEGVTPDWIVKYAGVPNEKRRQTFTITKEGNKVTKVKSEYWTYTIDEANMRKGYGQIIVEADKLILRREIKSKDSLTNETELFSSVKYSDTNTRILLFTEGTCTVSSKIF